MQGCGQIQTWGCWRLPGPARGGRLVLPRRVRERQHACRLVLARSSPEVDAVHPFPPGMSPTPFPPHPRPARLPSLAARAGPTAEEPRLFAPAPPQALRALDHAGATNDAEIDKRHQCLRNDFAPAPPQVGPLHARRTRRGRVSRAPTALPRPAHARCVRAARKSSPCRQRRRRRACRGAARRPWGARSERPTRGCFHRVPPVRRDAWRLHPPERRLDCLLAKARRSSLDFIWRTFFPGGRGDSVLFFVNKMEIVCICPACEKVVVACCRCCAC